MGLDASVKCRCWEDGLCHPPAALAPRLWYNPATAEVEQVTPEHLSVEDFLALDLEYDRWVAESACAHRWMCSARERISNWSGLREFQHALRSLGEGSYAALLREVANKNRGLTLPADARACLDELNRFTSLASFGETVQLVESTNGNVLHSRTGPYDGWIGANGAIGISRRLTADGFFQIEQGLAGAMQHDDEAKILFCSKRFSQARTPAAAFCLTDLSSGEQVRCADGLKDSSGRYPALLEVRQSKDSPARYAYCVEPLRRVFHAAIDTGHPVLWS
jgi:hypothetical protein